MDRREERGVMFIVSAPSGAGKTTLCRMAVAHFPGMRFAVSYTTRSPRKGEKEGEDYRFVSKATFQEMLERGEFLEWAEVHGAFYGTPKEDVERMLKEGHDVILDIDVQGAKQIKSKGKEGVYIFIVPPTLKACIERLRKRGLDLEEEIRKRVENAKKELAEALWYDYIIINDRLEEAFERLKSIIIAEKSRAFRMRVLLPKLEDD